jgi:oligoendopeptidase F
MKSKLKEVEAFAESEINAIVTAKKISDDLRGYRESYSETIQKYENEEVSIVRFIKTVTDYFPVAHRFYALRKKMLAIDGFMGYVDISAEAGTINTAFDFESASKIVSTAFSKVDSEFAAIFDRFLENGQIDAFPRIGKTSGAYCASFTDLPTFVLLNHISSFDSVKTLAHEMGHAIHGEFSKRNHVLYEHYTTSTAEVASTLFENFAFEEIFLKLSEQEKIIALHNKIMDNVATIFRQIAFINFETELHGMIRKEGFVSRDKISALMVKHLKSYLGPRFKLNPEDGLFWIRLSHIRRFFYMYTYAYGQLISNALYAKYQADHSFVEKIKKFLSAGGSDTPENIFKSIGIDTTKDEFWITGLKLIENDVARLEKLVHKKTKKK